jgi:enamine deaminase RidA (YjgF/YER057c/UK114 family)
MLCRALLEVQPVLQDLAVAVPPASSSNGSDSDCGHEAAAAAGAPASVEPGAAADASSGAAPGAVGVHVTQGACGSSGWRRILVHLETTHNDGSAAADSASCGPADDTRAAQAAAAADQIGAACRRSGGAAGNVCSLRCWYDVAPEEAASQSNATWQAMLLFSARECIGQQGVAVQLVQVSTVAMSTQLGPCWAVLEAYVEP